MLSFALTIVRHGETQYNKDGLLQGQGIDSSLSDIGVQQGESAGHYLQDVHFTDVFVSDMKRARQTAEIILRKNRTGCNLDIVTDPLLKERSFGIAEGGLVVNMKNMAKEAGQPIPEFTPPGGETMDQGKRSMGNNANETKLMLDSPKKINMLIDQYRQISTVKVRISTFLKSMFQQMVLDHRDKIQPYEGTQPGDTDGSIAGRPDDDVSNMSAHALVVSHGAYMRVAVRYFIEDLGCTVPPGANMFQVFAACPNTGMCRFIVTLKLSDSGILLSSMNCVFVNQRDHIKSVNN